MFDLSRAYRKMKREIDKTQMPYHQMVDILCNNCGQKKQSVFHIEGLECSGCPNSKCGFGYNTRRI